MKNIRGYIKYIYRYRYFWMYLARCDLIARYRRSKLGMVWMMMSPLLLTIIMSFVLGTAFAYPIASYAPYILAGMVTWDFISVSTVANGMTFISCDSYIRQFDHPVSIYTLKATVVAFINLLISMIGFVIWALFMNPLNVALGLLTLPLTLVIFFLLGWALATIAAFTNTKYRDYPQMMVLVVQAIWYLSPVFFQESMFMANDALRTWFNLNPITHLLSLLRNPFIYGALPSATDYAFSIGFVLILGLFAIRINKKDAKQMIFYL